MANRLNRRNQVSPMAQTVLAVFGLTAVTLALTLLGPSAANSDEAAYRAIAIAEDRRRPDDLYAHLTHADSGVRRRAILAIGRIQDSTAVSILLPLLSDSDLEVRREAVFALGQIGHALAREPLQKLLADPDESMVKLAIEALGKIGNRQSTAHILPLLRYPSPGVRAFAAVALWRLADSTALDALLERHADPDPDVRWRVLYALERIAAPDRVTLLGALHLDDADSRVRASAARTLGRQKSERGTAYLVQKLSDPDPSVVVNALRAWRQIADSTCASCVRSVLGSLSHGHPYVRVTAAEALGDPFVKKAADSAGFRETLDTLSARLSDLDPATRAASATSLIAHLGSEVLPRVEPLLSDSSIYVRTSLLRAFARLPAEAAVSRLMVRLPGENPVFERMTAALTLGELRAAEALPVLRAGLADTSLLYVAAVASAIEQLGDSLSISALVKAYAVRAGDADADARIAIRDALRALAGPTFADSIERAHPAANAQPMSYAADFHRPPTAKGARLITTAGDIEWSFFSQEAPQTVRNFMKLARAGYFNDRVVHRVVPNFVIQDGDPSGTGWGGPGYTIRCEYNALRYEPGRVGMALSGKDTGGSQWFITHSAQPHLDGRYTIFAQVTKGMEVVHRIVQGDRVLKVDILD